MKSSTKNRVKGIAKQVKGRVKEVAGQATRSRRLEQEGRAEAQGGLLRSKVGEVQEDLEDLAGE